MTVRKPLHRNPAAALRRTGHRPLPRQGPADRTHRLRGPAIARRTSGTIRNATNGSSCWKGSAAIEFEGEPKLVELERGSYLNIPAHKRHRVAWTSPTEKTIWLVILYAGG